jgi:beta-glucosidase
LNNTPQDVLQQLTLEEKVALCSGLDFWRLKGIERLGITPTFITDGPHGLRKQVENFERVDIRGLPATCFPTASATANSWNRELLFAIGSAIGEECRQESVAVVLGPGINIKRSPLCGRNFEYFSEDPLLSGELAAGFIDGVQSQGIGTSLKHFAVNNQEFRRNNVDAIVDARALHEIYLTGFEIAVKKSQPWTIMAAYNKVNGVYCSENTLLLQNILREAWGFKGLVVTDWGACNERVAGLIAGQDIEMPSSAGLNDAKILAAIKGGNLDVAVLDRTALRILTLILQAAAQQKTAYVYDREAHHLLARRAASESAVLLKNNGSTLPLRRTQKIALIGALAKEPRYQGAGSSQITPWCIDNAFDEFMKLAPDTVYAAGYTRHTDVIDEALIEEAVNVARAADVAVIFIGLTELYESEGFDRKHLRLPDNHNVLVERIAAANPKIVVVLANGAPVSMPWIGSAQAVLAGFLGGQACGSAIVDVLFGVANPSGKLAETYPLRLEDNLAQHYFPGGPDTVEYRESIFVGYRYYDSVRQPVLFPFGHGLSYCLFEYSDLQLSAQRIDEHDSLTVKIRIRNCSAIAGAEVVQLYVRDCVSTVFRPHKELKDFGKCFLQPGAQHTFEFTLQRRAFAYYDSEAADWRVESGEFEILIGASSADIRASAGVWVQSTTAINTSSATLQTRMPAYYPLATGAPLIDDASFAALYGAPLPSNRRSPRAAFDLNSTLSEIKTTFLGRQMYAAVLRNMQAMVPADTDPTLSKMMGEVVADMPLRQLVTFSGGKLNFELMAGLLSIMNGRALRGLRQLIGVLMSRKG